MQTVIVRRPPARRSATLKASAPPANDRGTAGPSSSASVAARFTVTAWSGRPERYIVASRSKTPRQLSTSSVFESFRPKSSPRASATARSRRNIGIASSYFRSCPKAASGIGTSPEAEPLVDDPPDPLRPEQRRVALHRRVQAALLEEVAGDRLDLVGRAAVHRRERHRVRQAGRDLDLADGREAAGDDVDVGRQPGRCVGHGVEVPLDVRPADPLEVVADAQVEEDARTLAGEAEVAVERVDEDPGAEVLVERLVDAQLLAPLDVVALVGDVDAGLVDVELVERLDRLELDDAGPGQPGRDDVLGQLGVRDRPPRPTACRGRRRGRGPGTGGRAAA